MDKRIKHMGMTMTEKEHKKWHKEQQDITPEQHEALMKGMGINEEDKEWHRTHDYETQETGQRSVNPFAIGGGFLEYCIKQIWLIREGNGKEARYYVTEKGSKEIKKFGIRI